MAGVKYISEQHISVILTTSLVSANFAHFLLRLSCHIWVTNDMLNKRKAMLQCHKRHTCKAQATGYYINLAVLHIFRVN